jgi:hypothetical protein
MKYGLSFFPTDFTIRLDELASAWPGLPKRASIMFQAGSPGDPEQGKKWSRLFEQLSPIYKWIPGGLS